MRTATFAAMMGAGVFLAGCVETTGTQTAQPQTEPPTNYRSAVLDHARQTFFDPYTVRDASISQPLQVGYGLTGQQMVWVVCVRANARNRMGGYTGIQETVVAFRGNAVDPTRSGSAGGGTACRGAVYSAFPELERLS
ncbi:hypothetical protein EOM89_01615 [Candidatus Falkowbacteria bacterium]|nr:hypothetical protein [Candidatus Falkowbacteria bacterium]